MTWAATPSEQGREDGDVVSRRLGDPPRHLKVGQQVQHATVADRVVHGLLRPALNVPHELSGRNAVGHERHELLAELNATLV